MMKPATRYLLLPLLLTVATGAEPLREISTWTRQPETCERRALLQYLRHDDVRVRSAALDLLEFLTGKDFGLDPWLVPADVPQPVQKELDTWAAAEEMAGDPATAPDAARLNTTVALLRTADPDTQRRLCLRYASWRPALGAALQKELAENAELSEKERDNLRCSLFRLQLQQAMTADVGHVVTLLTSHARNDILTGLEALRKTGRDALPVLMVFADSEDGLVREVAIDVLLQTGGETAYKILMPSLMKETDRNILQIAARRAPDSTPIICIVEFLNKLAQADDEDVAVAALEALGDMDESAAVEDPVANAGSRQALPPEVMITLLQKPDWRVRAAALRALQSKASFIPSMRDKDLQAALLKVLREDTDETVRAQAMHVLHKRHLVSLYMNELTDYAVRTPSATPYVVYLYCEQKATLSAALLDAVSRFSPEQVDQLVGYDDEYETVFDEDGIRRKSVKAVLESLLANPDPRVRRRLMAAWGSRLYVKHPGCAQAFLEWLKDPSVPALDKESPLHRLVFSTLSNHDLEKEYSVKLAEWLQQESDNPTMKDEKLQTLIYASLLKMRPDRTDAMLDERIEKLEPTYVDDLLDDCPHYFLKLRPEFAEKFVQHRDFYCIGSLLDADSKPANLIRERLVSMNLKMDHWERLMRHAIDSLSSDSSAESVSILTAALSDKTPVNRRAAAAFMLLASEAEGTPQLRDKIAPMGEPWDSYLQCVRECPRKGADVEAWAKKFHRSELPCVRRAVAGCLLPMESWKFYLPCGKNESPLQVSPSRFDSSGKRVSCPVSLIRLVQAMQDDDDPTVALVACASMLYRVGDCDRVRLHELLARLRQVREANLTDADDITENYLYGAVCRQMEGVWKRWSSYRGSGTMEFFKLKGSPKKLRPGLETVLAEYAESINDYPWSVLDEVKDKMPKRKSSGNKSGNARPHDFNFPAPPTLAEKEPEPQPVVQETAPEPAEAHEDMADAEDERTPVPVADKNAPVRVEFFHKSGCDVCECVQRRLRDLKKSYPGLEVVDYDVESEAGRERNTVLCARYGVEASKRRKAPALFAEAGVLLGDDAASERLDALVKESQEAGLTAQRLAASPEPTAAPQEPTETTPEPKPEPTPVIRPERLAETSATETAAATGEQVWEMVRSYGMLAIGGLVALLGALLVLFGRRKEE